MHDPSGRRPDDGRGQPAVLEVVDGPRGVCVGGGGDFVTPSQADYECGLSEDSPFFVSADSAHLEIKYFLNISDFPPVLRRASSMRWVYKREEAIRPAAGWIGGSRSAIRPAAGRIGGSRSAIRPAAGRTRDTVMLFAPQLGE